MLAIKYRDGAMMIADTLGSYGSLAMFKGLTRFHTVNERTVIGASGEYSDFQHITRLLDAVTTADFVHDDDYTVAPSEVHSYLSRVMYARRNKVDPLWNSVITAGINTDGAVFLGIVDLYGSNYTNDTFGTGYGHHLAIPILRERQKNDMSEADARTLLEDAIRVCYYRDARAINKYQIATVTAKDGVNISAPFTLDTQWNFKRFVDPADHS